MAIVYKKPGKTLTKVVNGMLIDGDSIDKIVRITNLPAKKVEELNEILKQEGRIIE